MLLTDLWTISISLKTILCETGSQCSSFKIGVIWHDFLDKVTTRAAVPDYLQWFCFFPEASLIPDEHLFLSRSQSHPWRTFISFQKPVSSLTNIYLWRTELALFVGRWIALLNISLTPQGPGCLMCYLFRALLQLEHSVRWEHSWATGNHCFLSRIPNSFYPWL